MFRKSILSDPSYSVSGHLEAQQSENDALMLLFLLADERDDLGLDPQALKLAQRQFFARQKTPVRRQTRMPRSRRHLRA